MQTELIFYFVTLGLWVAGWIVLGRITACGDNFTTIAKSSRTFSIIIPARNEGKNLPTLLRSIRSQSLQPLEIIVVNDASTDDTAAQATNGGATVIESKELPEGWRGKTWACHQGAMVARGDILVFMDADTWFEPGGWSKLVAEFEGLTSGVLSVAPHHQVVSLHEQASAFFNLVMLAGSRAFTVRANALAPTGLFGQFLMISREHYRESGGHEAVKGRVLENFWMAENLDRCGVKMACRAGRGALAFRMYANGWSELIEGWTKGFASGAGQTPLPILMLVVFWMIGLMFALLGLILFSAAPMWIAAYLLSAGQTIWLLNRVGTFHWLTGILYPLSLVFFFAVFARSASRARRKQTVRWKGREISAG